MRLSDLSLYDTVTIQCHDNPDADSIGSGFGLYKYFEGLGKNVRFIYGGRFEIAKACLKLMISECDIPIEYVGPQNRKFDGLLVMVDCQYGAGNVTGMFADNYAVIDHHSSDGLFPALSEIRSDYGSCCTLVWSMLKEEKSKVLNDVNVSTAFYFGLFSDTNQFAEIFNPNDREMKDGLQYNAELFSRLKNSNISLKDLETAGVALLRNIHNEEHRYSIMHAEKCDPNMLGILSDFLLQVDVIDTCVAYISFEDGIKFSVRSCVKDIKANELAIYLCDGIGSGGGHEDKSGGFISRKLYEERYHGVHTESFFSQKLNEYFENR